MKKKPRLINKEIVPIGISSQMSKLLERIVLSHKKRWSAKQLQQFFFHGEAAELQLEMAALLLLRPSGKETK